MEHVLKYYNIMNREAWYNIESAFKNIKMREIIPI